MNIKTMKFLDGYIGVPVCLLLTILAKIKRLFKVTDKNGEIKKILLIKFLGMGSIILSTPMINAIKQKYPNVRIYFLTFNSNKGICRLIDSIDQTFTIRTTSFYVFFKDLLYVIYVLRKEKLDVSIDMEFFSKFSLILSTLINARIRIGFFLQQIWRKTLLDHHIYYNHYKHLTKIYCNMIKPLNIECEDYTLITIPVQRIKSEQVHMLLKGKVDLSNETLVCVNVNASDLCPERRWPKDNFINLIIKILDNIKMLGNFSLKLILIGSPGEQPYVQQVYQEIPKEYKERIIDLSGKTDINMLLELFRISQLLITNDSGPLHFAEMVGLETISFFGPETPLLYGPLGENHTVFFKELYCSPCLNVYNVKTAFCNGENKCMQAITVDKVFAKVTQRLADKRGGKC